MTEAGTAIADRTAADPGKCSKPHARIAGKNVKSRLNHPRTGRSTAKIAIQSIRSSSNQTASVYTSPGNRAFLFLRTPPSSVPTSNLKETVIGGIAPLFHHFGQNHYEYQPVDPQAENWYILNSEIGYIFKHIPNFIQAVKYRDEEN